MIAATSRITTPVVLAAPVSAPPTGGTLPAAASPRDTFSSRKAVGTIGAAVGVVVCRTAVPVASGVGVGMLVASTFLGPIGGTIAGLAAFVGGAAAEYKWRPGRVAGGMAGGLVGSAVGAALDKVGWKPSAVLAKETQGFSLRHLWRDCLFNTSYTSHKPLGSAAEAALQQAQPGDILLLQDEHYFKDAAFIQKFLGKSGAWTHPGMISGQGLVIDIMSGRSAEERDANRWSRYRHLAVLRPRYQNADSAQGSIDYLRSQFPQINAVTGAVMQQGVAFDSSYSLKTDDKQYCAELIYKALRAGAPEIQVKPSSFFGFKYVSADDFLKSKQIDVVYNSGSSFWLNHLSGYD